MITVLSAKGGSGKTVVATNLAQGLNEEYPGQVVLVDMDIQFGDCGATLNLDPEQTLADAALNASVLDATTLKVFLTPHPSGLFLLGPPQSLVDAAEITTQQVKAILDLLVGIFDYVVIDTASGIDDHAITSMEFSHRPGPRDLVGGAQREGNASPGRDARHDRDDTPGQALRRQPGRHACRSADE